MCSRRIQPWRRERSRRIQPRRRRRADQAVATRVLLSRPSFFYTPARLRIIAILALAEFRQAVGGPRMNAGGAADPWADADAHVGRDPWASDDGEPAADGGAGGGHADIAAPPAPVRRRRR
eukprot:4428412-Pyramimonas_sp.AAC.1